MIDIILRSPEQKVWAKGQIDALDLTKPWVLTLRRHTKKRSTSQNSLLHKWLDIIADETGNSPEDVKEAMKEEFLGMVEVDVGGRPYMVRKHTSSLTTEEMTTFLNQIYAFAAQDLDIRLPVPEDAHIRR